MEIDDEYIIKKYFGKSGRLNGNFSTKEYLSKNDSDALNYLEHRYSDSESLRETFLRIYYGIEERPICPICGEKKVKWRGKRYKLFADSCCDGKCYCKVRENNMVVKYGKPHLGCSPESVEKIRKTKKERYGDEGYNNKEKRFATNLERYGSTYAINEEILQKRRETCFKHYGVDVPAKSKEVQEKMKETCLKKYGVDNYRKSDECLTKILTTKKKNGTMNSSHYEVEAEEWLIESFGGENIIHQYKDERYKNPQNGHKYNCDFYIKNLDIFIELQMYWGHGPHPYDENNEEDKKMMGEIKERIKKKPYYKRILQGWGVDDVTKRKVAAENNLKYIEIFDRKITKEKFINILKNYGRVQTDKAQRYYL